MAKNIPTILPGTPPPEAAQTLLALLHAQGEVARLSEREQLFSSLLDSVNAVLWAFDWETRQVLYVSPAYERIFGRPVSLVLADYNEWRDSIYPDDLEYAERSLAQVLLKGSVEDREYRILNADGQLRWLSDKCYINQQHDGDRVIIVGIAEDITEKKQLEGELQRLATTDVLTQSSNRRHFFECAQQAFDNAREAGTPLAFLLLDIDDFKRINDSYGHLAGDKVLKIVADQLRKRLRARDFIARFGGEEFVLLLPQTSPAAAAQVAEALRAAIEACPFHFKGERVVITTSIGLSTFRSGERGDQVLKRADAALYRAKDQGRNRVLSA